MSWPAVVAGATIFALAYALPVGFAAALSAPHPVSVWGAVLVPVAGPVIWSAQFSAGSALLVAFNVSLAVLQGGGVALAAVGLFVRPRVLVRDAPSARARASVVAWSVSPVGPQGTPGISLGAAYF